jgi:hypothetical protein
MCPILWAVLPARLDLPILPQVLTAAIRSKAQKQAARQGDLALIRVDHRRPPLHRHVSSVMMGRPHADGDLLLGTGAALPILADRIAAGVGLLATGSCPRRVNDSYGFTPSCLPSPFPSPCCCR